MVVGNLVLLILLLFKYSIADPITLNASESVFRYEPTWESIDSRPLPAWYDKAKIGIFLHFGVYSASAFSSEWFWTHWEQQKKPEYIEFMTRTQRPGFTYQEFAEQFKCEHFNPNKWADIFKDAGANYVVLTSKHHEGYTLYPSTYSSNWNSVDIGPGRDLIKEVGDAVRTKGMKFGLYYSLYEWFNRMYLDDKKNGFKERNFIEKRIWPELKEIVNTYKPEVVWSDGDWEAGPEYWRSKEFISWLYNDSPVKDTVVTNDRWGSGTMCNHGGFLTCSDRWNPGKLQTRKFENAMTIDKRSWGHRAEANIEDFYTSDELIREVVSTVAVNGNILINIGPTKYGTIESIFADRLRDMGKWLKINGKAIYETRPWPVVQREGNIWFTMKTGPIRDTVFAFVLDYPYDDNFVILESLGEIFDEGSEVKLVGFDGKIEHEISQSGLRINFPEKRFLDKAGLFSVWTFAVDIPKPS